MITIYAPLHSSDKANSGASASIHTSSEPSMAADEASRSHSRTYESETPIPRKSAILQRIPSHQQAMQTQAQMRNMQQTIGNRATMQIVASLNRQQAEPVQRSIQPTHSIAPTSALRPISMNRSEASRPVIQRQVNAQIIADKSNPSQIGRVFIAGRPERVFGGTMGDHTTAFSVHVEAVRLRVEGFNVADAIRNMYELMESVGNLLGMKLVEQLPPSHAEKFEAAGKEVMRVHELIQKAAEMDDPSLAILFLQEFITAYLSFRELVPLSVINVKAKAAYLAGKGKGESGKAALLADHQRGIHQNQRTLYESILGMFDVSSVALAAVEQSKERTASMAPGLASYEPIIRMRAYVTQHIQSIKASFPNVFDNEKGIDSTAVAETLMGEVMREAQEWLEWQKALDEQKIKSKTEQKTRLQLDMALLNAEYGNRKKQPKELTSKQAAQTSLEKEIEILKSSTDRTKELTHQYGLRLEQQEDFDYIESSVGTREEGELEQAIKEGQDEQLDEEQTDDEFNENEEQAEEEQERNQQLATQVVLNKDGLIREIRSSGRTKSPFSGTMGAHTTAWVVHVDRIRQALMNKTIEEAYATMTKELIPEALKRAKAMGEAFPSVISNLEDLYNDLIQPRKFGSVAEAALFLQQFINDLLTYINYTPGSTLESADTGGKGEGRRRQLLLLHEAGKPQPKTRLQWAILGLLDVKAAKPETHLLLLKHHLELIQSTYPKSYVDSGVGSMKWKKGGDITDSLKKHTGKRGEGKSKKEMAKEDAGMDPFKSKFVMDFGLFASKEHDIVDEADEEFALVDAEGGILPEAQQTFIDAYRYDVVHSRSFLTEGEGNIIANHLGISVQIYRGNLPDGFERIENPGGGHCLIHALQQIYHAFSNGTQVEGATEDEITTARTQVALQLADDDIIALAGAAVMARITGAMEPGLGPSMRDLLNDRSILNVSLKRLEPKAPKVSEGASQKREGSQSSAKGDGVGAPAVGVGPLVSIGNGTPLVNNVNLLQRGIASLALLHTGGNHYIMIYRRG